MGIILNHEIRIPIQQSVFHGSSIRLFFFSWLMQCLVSAKSVVRCRFRRCAGGVRQTSRVENGEFEKLKFTLRWWYIYIYTHFFLEFSPRNLGKWSNLTCAYFSDGFFNHQLVFLSQSWKKRGFSKVYLQGPSVSFCNIWPFSTSHALMIMEGRVTWVDSKEMKAFNHGNLRVPTPPRPPPPRNSRP